MGASARPAGSVSGHSRTRGQPVQGWIETGRRLTKHAGVGTIDLSLCRGAMTSSALRAAQENLLGDCEALVRVVAADINHYRRFQFEYISRITTRPGCSISRWRIP